MSFQSKIIQISDLSNIRIKNSDKIIVHCHGVYDLFHYGHLLHLRSAKLLGDLLIVSITPDEFVNKGPGRPRFNEIKRLEMLASVEIIDYVVLNHHPTSVELIKLLRPNYYVKGPDYKIKNKDITGGIYDEERAVVSIGGELIITDDEAHSSTSLINENFSQFSNVQKELINKIKNKFGTQYLIDQINSLEKLNVMICGEAIIDKYIFCKPENLSSKSASISANFLNEESYPGGTWAVALHAAELGCNVDMLVPIGDDYFTQKVIETIPNYPNLFPHYIQFDDIKTPLKTRFISPSGNQRMFELTHLDNPGWSNLDWCNFTKVFLELSMKNDLLIALDFGHGLWESGRLELLSNNHTFVALNVQTNSGNYGFNLFHKHTSFNYLVLDERELRLGLHDRFKNKYELAKEIGEKIKTDYSITFGAEGSAHFSASDDYELHFSPIFFNDPIDTVGAGDAYFAVTSLLKRNGTDPELIPFIGNIYAGLKTKIMGNKKPVNKIDLIRSITSILG